MGVLREQASPVDATSSPYSGKFTVAVRAFSVQPAASEDFSDPRDSYRNFSAADLLHGSGALQEARVFDLETGEWYSWIVFQTAGGLSLVAMALVLLAAVGYHCANTWRWIRGRSRRSSEDSQCDSLSRQTAIRISHSLPDLQTEPLKQEYVQEHKENTKKVLRQTTLPIVPTRHQTFQRQLSHRLDLPSIQFSICSLERADSSIGLIKPELYKNELVRQSSTDSSADLEFCGKLHFALRYDQEIEGLIVKVLEAHDLPIKDVTGSSDPYIKVFLLPDRKKKFQTKVHRKNLNPVFNETFIFSVSYEDLRQRQLQFSVYDFDRFSRHDLIGHVALRGLLESADLQQEIEYTMNILCAPQDGKVNDVVFIDWQIIRIASPVTDLAYMVSFSLDQNLLEARLQDLWDLYYATLEKHINLMGCDAEKCYPKNIFREHLKKLMVFGLVMGICGLSITLSEPGEARPMEEIFHDVNQGEMQTNICDLAAKRLNGLIDYFVKNDII